MASLNYDISINAIDEAGDNLADVKVHAYFYKVNDNSSDSVWDEEIRLTAGNGAVSFNLGDDSFLTSEGKIDDGDMILITAWLTDNTDTSIDDKTSKTEDTITRCVNILHTVDTSSTTWDEEITVLEIQRPICDIDIPEVTLTGHEFTITNNSTISTGPFSANDRDDLYQKLTHYSQDLFLGREIKETNYDLGEDNTTLDGITDRTYSYIDAGDYSNIVTVYNYLGYACAVQLDQHILYNQPTISFDYTFTKLLNTDEHIGVGNDDELSTIQESTTNYGDTWEQLNATFDWSITDKNQDDSDNSDEYLGENEDYVLKKLFNTSSLDNTKTLTLTINWNDGFDDHQETLSKNPYLDIYDLELDFDWITSKEYKETNYIPIGDDDLVHIDNLTKDSASQNYNSEEQWNTITYVVTKLKNDGSDDNETFDYNSTDDTFTESPEFYIKHLHDSDNPATVDLNINYWDGYKDIDETLSKDIITDYYHITHEFHWESIYGSNKIIVHDEDEVTLVNDTTFGPLSTSITKMTYDIQKDKYASYDDDTIEDDSEFVELEDLSDTSFYVRAPQTLSVENVIYYYDGYDDVSSTLSKDITSEVLEPIIDFSWETRNGTDTYAEGRDDDVILSNTSVLLDSYDTGYDNNSSRQISLEYTVDNNILAGGFKSLYDIGGEKYDADETNTDVLTSEANKTNQVNFWSEGSKNINLILYYNDGYLNVNTNLDKSIDANPYSDLEPNAIYSNNIPDRNSDVKFIDDSTNNENRIINEDWTLTDRYSDLSMTYDSRGEDNLQFYPEIDRETEISTNINSNENHTLTQYIRWDNGFKEVNFEPEYTISTLEYTLEPELNYIQKYVTGPEIIFNDATDFENKLKYNLIITDEDNDGNDTSETFNDIGVDDTQQYVYKSVSNSPFDDDEYNKNVNLNVYYDNGWDESQHDKDFLINVKPNRITQDFIIEALRHDADTVTDEFTITGNNPFKFYDNSTTLRIDDDSELDYSFINSVNYNIEDCEE